MGSYSIPQPYKVLSIYYINRVAYFIYIRTYDR